MNCTDKQKTGTVTAVMPDANEKGVFSPYDEKAELQLKIELKKRSNLEMKWAKALLITCANAEKYVDALRETLLEKASQSFYSGARMIPNERVFEEVLTLNDRIRNISNAKLLVDKSLSEVNEKHKDVLCLRHFTTLTVSEIAERLQTSERNVFRRYVSALQELYRKIAKNGYSVERLQREYENEKFVRLALEETDEKMFNSRGYSSKSSS